MTSKSVTVSGHCRRSGTSLPPRVARAIKRADATAAFLEAVNLAGFSLAEAKRYFPRPEMPTPVDSEMLDPWSAAKATRRFLLRFSQITRGEPEFARLGQRPR